LIDYPTTTPLLKGRDLVARLGYANIKEQRSRGRTGVCGEPSPYSFSGMVKHTFLRQSDYQNDLQIVLTEKGKRKASSHEIIESLRPIIREFSIEKGAIYQSFRNPARPAGVSNDDAEIYGPDEKSRGAGDQRSRKYFCKRAKRC